MRLPTLRVERGYESAFALWRCELNGPSAGSFSSVSGLCLLSAVFACCPPLLLVPGCSGPAPAYHSWSHMILAVSEYSVSGCKDEIVFIGVSVMPRLGSLSNSGRML